MVIILWVTIKINTGKIQVNYVFVTDVTISHHTILAKLKVGWTQSWMGVKPMLINKIRRLITNRFICCLLAT